MDNIFSMNMAWPTDTIDRKKEYENWIEICKKFQISCIRVFLVPWGIDPIHSSDDMRLLCELLQKTEEMFIEVVLVLDTYVNYIVHTYREFANSDYGWYNNDFSKNKSLKVFLTEKGKTQYLDKVFEILKIIKQYKNVRRIELCNEIDQIESKKRNIVFWINNNIKELHKTFGKRFEYRVSISNYRDYLFFSKNVICICDIHSYRFPYSNALENYEYISAQYPRAWISEFACYSDFAYSELIESKIYFSAMVTYAYFEKCKDFPAPWWWEKILPDSLYMSVYNFLSYINLELKKKEIKDFSIKELIKKKHDIQMKNKVRDRLAVLKKNPVYIKQEIPAIRKFLWKILHSKYNHNYALVEYESQSGEKYVILETYVPIEMKYNYNVDITETFLCIDMVRNQTMFSKKFNEKVLLRKGTYLIIIPSSI